MKRIAKKKVEERWCGKATDALRQKVAIYATMTSLPREQIARQIGCDEKTLVLHFKNELENGRKYLRQRVVQFTRKSARNGSVPAMLLLHKVTSGKPIDGRGRWKRPAKRPVKPKLGKKAQAQAEAERLMQPGSWLAPASPPLLVIDNSEKPKKR